MQVEASHAAISREWAAREVRDWYPLSWGRPSFEAGMEAKALQEETTPRMALPVTPQSTRAAASQGGASAILAVVAGAAARGSKEEERAETDRARATPTMEIPARQCYSVVLAAAVGPALMTRVAGARAGKEAEAM